MQFQSKKRRDIDIPITSLIDVMFTLLVFLLISTSFDTPKGLKVDLPQSSTVKETLGKHEQLRITVHKDRSLLLQGQSVDQRNLTEALRKQGTANPQQAAIIEADRDVPHGFVIAIMDAIKLSGIKRVTFALDQVPEPSPDPAATKKTTSNPATGRRQ